MIFIWKNNSLTGYENNSYLNDYHITIDECLVSNYFDGNVPKLFIDSTAGKSSNIRFQLFLSNNIKSLIEYTSKTYFTVYSHSSEYVEYLTDETNNFSTYQEAKNIAEYIIEFLSYKILNDDLELFM